jgi:thioredoxin 1
MKMKRTLTLLSIFFITLSTGAYAKGYNDGDRKDTQNTSVGVKFLDGGWFEAVAEAKREGKPIFAFVWSNNCLESMRMLEDIFTDKEIGAFFNENFVNYKIDGNELKNNMRVTQWGVQGLPTLLFFTPKRKMVLTKKGFHKNEDLIRVGKIALKKM